MQDHTKRENTKRGLYFIILAMLAFSGLGLEALLAFVVEPLIYGTDMSGWTSTQNITHWVVTCAMWTVVAISLIIFSRQKFEFNLLKKGDSIGLRNWIFAFIFIALLGVISYWDWNGFKVVKEYLFHGPILFSFQYVYYFVETVLVYLMIVYAHEAGERFFKSKYVPYGGIFLALTWGLIHTLTKGSWTVGLLSALFALVMGRIYVLMGKDVRKALPLIFIALII